MLIVRLKNMYIILFILVKRRYVVYYFTFKFFIYFRIRPFEDLCNALVTGNAE